MTILLIASVKTLCSPLSVDFWSHCVLWCSGGTQRCALPRHHSEKIKIANVTFPCPLVPLRYGWSQNKVKYIKYCIVKNRYYFSTKL